MSSSASSSTAGSNAAGAANQSGQAGGDVGNHGSDGSGPATSGPEGNIVEKQASGGAGGRPGTAEPHVSSPAHHRQGGGGGTTSSTGTVLRRKTNVCLICGIYTNLSLNIFEPRSGPNIVDVIYEKYKFRAERGDNADKHICFSCNNWLINWYSLQNTSSGSSRTYEPAPSTSRSSSAAAADSSNNSRNGTSRRQHTHKPRTKAHHNRGVSASSSPSTGVSHDKENRPQPDQHGQISSTTEASPDEGWRRSTRHPYPKANGFSARRSLALKESNGQRAASQRSILAKQNDPDDVVSSSTEESTDPYTILVKPFESRLIQMLQGQGTSVTKEHVSPNIAGPWVPRPIDRVNGNRVKQVYRRSPDANGNNASEVQNEMEQRKEQLHDDESSKEIVISFDTTLAEVIDVVPSLKAIQSWYGNEDALEANAQPGTDPVRSLHQRLSSGSLTMSVLGSATPHRSSGYEMREALV
uniref:ZAD domain-containing protein n=1 Tax=Anopheles epiroticus TaxID=199890 RepID=A0A182P5D0_9DIPT